MQENEEKRFTFSVEGMTCSSCVRIVERSLRKMDGVHFVSINLGTEKAYVITDKNITFEDIKKQVDSTGYKAIEKTKGKEKVEEDFLYARKRLFISLVLFFPVTFLMIFHMAGYHMPWFEAFEAFAGAIAIFGPGRSIYRGALIAAKHFHANMDTLVGLAAFAAWATALLHISSIPVTSFGSLSVMLIALHLAGRYIESRLRYRASSEIRSLLEMRPSTATILIGEKEEEIPIENVPVGALLVVRSGERIPLDGIIKQGSAYIDESMITGEPLRVHKRESEEVTGGTVLESGFIKLEVIRTGEDTFISRMIRLVEDAQSSSVPIQAFADKITGIFVPAIFSLALLSALLWFFFYENLSPYLLKVAHIIPWVIPQGQLSHAIFIFIAVLVIACPCAMGLATPMALVAGTGLAASKGLIIKNGEAMQKAHEIKNIFVDKTGTLTKGSPEVTFTNLSDRDLAFALTLEKASIHPFALAIKKFCQEKNIKELTAQSIKETAGEGVYGIVDGHEVFIGRPEDPQIYNQSMKRGETIIELKIDNHIAGYFAISDPIKEDAAAAISMLQGLGINVFMLTGDNTTTAMAVANSLGIKNVISNVRPEEKLMAISEMQKKGMNVAMIGDGINDAAALKSADLGIALGSGTDLSIESADIIITSNRLSAIYDAIKISRLTYDKIKGNLFWAFIYNIIAIPIALAGLLHPVIAEICMLFSSINVVLNSLKIKKGY